MVIGSVISGRRAAIDSFPPLSYGYLPISCSRVNIHLIGIANMRSCYARDSVEPDNVLNRSLPVIIILSIKWDNVCVFASNFPVIPRVVPLFLSEKSFVVVRVAIGSVVSSRWVGVILS